MAKKQSIKPRRKQHQLFCEYYVADKSRNGSASADKAGYAKAGRRVRAVELLKRDDVKKYIAHLDAERAKRVKVDADYVLQKLSDMAEADIGDLFDDDGAYLPIKQWPLIFRQMLSAFEVQEVIKNTGNDKKITTIIKPRFVTYDKTLELLGKHVGVKAFSEIREFKASDDLVEAIYAARKRSS